MSGIGVVAGSGERKGGKKRMGEEEGGVVGGVWVWRGRDGEEGGDVRDGVGEEVKAKI